MPDHSPESVACGSARRPTNPAGSLHRSTAQPPGPAPGGPRPTAPKRHPALDVQAAAPHPGGLPWLDAVAAAVDDHRPSAIDEPAPDRVRAFFESAADRDRALTAVTQAHGDRVRARAMAVSDDNWAARSQASLTAVRVGRVIVAPPWAAPPDPGPDGVVVTIRPALGFGSGHHPSTRLALRGLQALDLTGRQVLDVGTGSGVLAIAAVKLGAERATGIDRDPDALDSARDAVDANRVAAKVELRRQDAADIEPGGAAVVVANLTGAALVRLAPAVAALVEPGGSAILSGILAEEETAVAAAYRAHGEMAWRAAEDEWVGMTFRVAARG